MLSASLVESAKTYLNSHHIFVHEAWLTECLEFFLGMLTERDIIKELSIVKEQFYLNDLKDICNGCLPENLKQKKEITLPNKYLLQINSIIDIGKPAYPQYMELQKVDLGDIEVTKTYEERIPTCRMLKLNMTDGAQDIVGIEYRTIRRLHVNIPPGFKILIKGPVVCRNGILLLDEKNCDPLDGEVDVLKENNSQAMVLERQLRLFDSDKIRSITTSTTQLSSTCPTAEITSVNSSTAQESIPTTSKTQHNYSRSSSDSTKSKQQPFGLASDSSRLGPPETFSGRPSGLPSSVLENISMEEDDFQDMDIEVDPQELDKIEAQFSQNLNRSDEIVSPPEKKLKTDRNDEFPDDDDGLVLLHSSNEEHFSDIDESNIFNENHKPVINIKEINVIKEKAFKSFTVKAKIANILTKLSVTKDSWKLSCNLSDNTDNIDVSFSNEVLQRIIGYTPQQMYQLKKQIETRPEMKEKGSLIISEAKEKFKNLNCKMIIEYKSDSNIPIVTDLIDYC